MKHKPTGPFAPPKPSEAESDEAQPMAAARDEDTPHDAAKPTTASKDAYAPDVAKRWAAHGAHGGGVTESREENRAQEAVSASMARRQTLSGDIGKPSGMPNTPNVPKPTPRPNERSAEDPSRAREPSPVRPPDEPTPKRGEDNEADRDAEGE